MQPKKEKQVQATYPLSPMQQGMLLSSIHERNSGVYVQQFVCAVRDHVDLPILRSAWREVIRRHSVLRTGFRWAGLPEPIQEVYLQTEPAFLNEDWSQLSTTEQELRMNSFLDSDRRN